jgi:hypothetical protein
MLFCYRKTKMMVDALHRLLYLRLQQYWLEAPGHQTACLFALLAFKHLCCVPTGPAVSLFYLGLTQQLIDVK